MIKLGDMTITGMYLGDRKVARVYAGADLVYEAGIPVDASLLQACYDYNGGQVALKGGFYTALVNQTDYAPDGRLCWKAGTPMPNPHRPDLDPACVMNSANSMFAQHGGSVFDVSLFDTSQTSNMFKMFYSCQNVRRLDLSSFDTRSATSMHQMFASTPRLTYLDLSSFDTTNADIRQMFLKCGGAGTVGYCRAEELDKLNAQLIADGVTAWKFQVKPA